jgi:hypothetical protein
MPGGSESTTAAVRRALELGTTAVQEVRTAAAEEQRKALEDNNRHWEERLHAEELRWESASATLGERLTQRFEAAATSEQLTKALAAAKAAYANEAMAAQRAAVDEAVAACAREAAVAHIKAVEAEYPSSEGAGQVVQRRHRCDECRDARDV